MELYAGSSYKDAQWVIVLSFVEVPIVYSNFLVVTLSNASGNLRPQGTIEVITQLFNLLVTVILVCLMGFGAIGCVLGTAISRLLFDPLLLLPLGWRLAGVTGREWLQETVVPAIWPALSGSLTWTACNIIASPNGWVGLSLTASLGSAVYISTIVVFCLKEEDKGDLKRIICRVLRKSFTANNPKTEVERL
jgi:hypothetical protein